MVTFHSYVSLPEGNWVTMLVSLFFGPIDFHSLWSTYPSEKCESQLGLFFPIYGEKSMFQTANQLMWTYRKLVTKSELDIHIQFSVKQLAPQASK